MSRNIGRVVSRFRMNEYNIWKAWIQKCDNGSDADKIH